MERAMTQERVDELLSDSSVDWLMLVPEEITSYWAPKELGINEELV